MQLMNVTTFYLWIYHRTTKTKYSRALSSTGIRSMHVATHFTRINPSTDFVASPPYIPTNLRKGIRCRGAVRDKNGNEIIFTGPKLTVVYSGCNYNSVVFKMDSTQAEFEKWLALTWSWLQDTIGKDGPRFKARGRPTFNNFIVMPSRDPEVYSPELRVKLATVRNGVTVEDVTVTTVIECQGERVDPSQVWSGAFMTPIFRLNYYKDGDDFGLALTLLKAEYECQARTQISNDAWMIDSKTSGSGSVSMSEDMEDDN